MGIPVGVKFNIIIILVMVIVMISGCGPQSGGSESPIAMTENGDAYVLDTVDTSVHPFAYINLNDGEVKDIEDRLNDELISEAVQAAKSYLLNKKDEEEETPADGYIALSSIEINSVIVDSEKSAKVTARLNYIKLDKNPNTIEKIPVTIDGSIVTLPHPDKKDSPVPVVIDYYRDICLYLYYEGNQYQTLKEVLINQEYNNNDDGSSQEQYEEQKYNPALELLYAGKTDGIPFGIGTNSIEIIEQWGEPDHKDNFMGGLLLSYEDIFFFTDGLLLNDRITYGDVTGIYYTGEKTLFGIQAGMSLEQVEELLGTPDHTYIAQYSELFTDNNLIVNYRAGEYTADFEIDDESETVQSISIWKEEN